MSTEDERKIGNPDITKKSLQQTGSDQGIPENDTRISQARVNIEKTTPQNDGSEEYGTWGEAPDIMK